MRINPAIAQTARVSALLLTAGGLYFAIEPTVEDGYVASILACLAFVVLAPVGLGRSGSDRRARRDSSG